jgi:glycosyltransferase involved in cell wall biosynthesis
VVRAYQPDVIHTTLFTGNLVGQLAARATGTPVLSTFVLSGDLDLLKQTQPGAATARAALLRRLAAASARASKAEFRALTEDAKATNCQLLRVPTDRVEVISRGAPQAIYDAMGRSELGLPASGPLVVNVARLAAQKGQVMLLRAFALVAAQQPDVHLVIVGREGVASVDVAAEIDALGLADRVTLLGYTPYARHVLAHASVFAFTSRMEGLGTAVLEAQSAGIPVVSFDIPPVREATDDGRAARLVAVGDIEGIAEGIMQGLRGELDENADHGLRVSKERSDLSAVSASLEQARRRVAGVATS